MRFSRDDAKITLLTVNDVAGKDLLRKAPKKL